MGVLKCALESTKTARALYEAAGYRAMGDGNVMSKDLAK